MGGGDLCYVPRCFCASYCCLRGVLELFDALDERTGDGASFADSSWADRRKKVLLDRVANVQKVLNTTTKKETNVL